MTYSAFKRVFDIVMAAIALILLSPILLFVILICRNIHGRGNIFFLQERVGQYGRIFKVIKFKTMTDDRDENGILLPDEERQTAWGHFMRRASIDELLQLINVIKGDMSIIGPRPLIEEQVIYATGKQLCRFNVKPGITGLAQVCGRNDLQFAQRFKYDVWYVDHMGFALDMHIIMMTMKVVVKGSGMEYNPEVKKLSEVNRNA